MAGLPGETAFNLLAPPVQLASGNITVAAFIDNIVDLLAEGVQRCNCAALFSGNKQETVIEAGPALRDLVLAILVGRHSVKTIC